MATYLANSVLLAVTITFLQVLTGSFAAYGFSKVRFPGRDVLFLGYIATIAVPWQAYMVPQYIMMQRAGADQTATGRSSCCRRSARSACSSCASTTCRSRTNCARPPASTGSASTASSRRIMLPLSKPALASLALLTFVNTWNDYMGPFIYLTSNGLWTVQLGLRSFVGQFDAEYAMIMTGAVISVMPILVIFLFGQRYFIQGIATSGMKG